MVVSTILIHGGYPVLAIIMLNEAYFFVPEFQDDRILDRETSLNFSDGESDNSRLSDILGRAWLICPPRKPDIRRARGVEAMRRDAFVVETEWRGRGPHSAGAARESRNIFQVRSWNTPAFVSDRLVSRRVEMSRKVR